MQSIKAAVAVFCTACICAELVAQLTENSWARRGIKAVAGLYILTVALQAFPQVKAEWSDVSVPAVSSVALGTLEDAVLAQTETELEKTLEAQCQKEYGVAVTLDITMKDTPEDVNVQSVTVTPLEECTAEKQQAVDAFLQQTLGIQPEWNTPGGETLR